MLAKLTQPHENIPAGYRVKVLDLATGEVQVLLDGTLQTLTVNPSILEPIQSILTTEQLTLLDNRFDAMINKQLVRTLTPAFTPSPKIPLIFTDEGITISCRCGNITRKVLSANIRRFEYEQAAINSVIAMCAYCSKRPQC